MKRTPQHAMSQSRLTANGGNLGLNTASLAQAPPDAPGTVGAGTGPMEVAGGTSSAPSLAGQGAGEPLTAEFFKNLIGENTKTITGKIDKLTKDLLTLTSSVDANRTEITKNATETHRQGLLLDSQKNALEKLDERLSRLEGGGTVSTDTHPAGQRPRPKSHEYLRARRSVRIWPVNRLDEDSLWKGTGEFIHEALHIPVSDVCQDDIESVIPVPDPRFPTSSVNNEALVTFFCPRKRDLLLSNSQNLSSFVDGNGRPTAGIRLEIPAELDDTFRLLSRFGTRLRARHGEGTKRHIKFDDHEASLYINIKLPGDTSWARVSPAMAKNDLDQTTREESARLFKRITATATSGPRQRLAVPAPAPGPSSSSAAALPALRTAPPAGLNAGGTATSQPPGSTWTARRGVGRS